MWPRAPITCPLHCHFQAFYKGDTSLLVEPSKSWESILDSPLFIRGDYHLTAASHVLADPILVLHFVLVSISPKGNPAQVMSEILGGFLMEGSFMYEEIIFDLANDKLVRQYTDAITILVQTLEGCVYFLFCFIVLTLLLVAASNEWSSSLQTIPTTVPENYILALTCARASTR